MKNTAFKKWLLMQDREYAIHYVYECMRSGPSPNMAWELLEEFNGEWSCKPELILELIASTLEALELDVKQKEA